MPPEDNFAEFRAKQAELAKRVKEKRSELALLQKFRALTASLGENFLIVSSKIHDMSSGNATVADVLESWLTAIESTSLASIALTQNAPGKPNSLPATLVRFRVQLDENSDQE